MKIIYNLLAACILVSMISCEKLTDINIDPDVSSTAKVEQVLTSAIGYTAFVVDGRYNEFSYLWGQYWTWGPGVSLGNAERFVAEPDDHNLLWARSYSNALADIDYLTDSDESAFAGIGKIMEAYVMQGLVDHFGDVPYSEAIRGEIGDGAILAPAYDDAKTIYGNLITRIDEAMVLLNASAAGDVGSEDLVFGGDLEAWKTFGRSLKLRLIMRQSVTGDAGALGTLANGVIGKAGLLESGTVNVAFAGTAGDENPMFAIRESGIGNFYVASNATLNVLNDLGDPRINSFFDDAPNFPGEVRGIDQSAIINEPFTAVREDYSQGSALTYGAANDVILMSSWEVWFLRAEAAVRYNTGEDAEDAWANGIRASFAHLGTAGVEAYISTLTFGADANAQIASIAVQKWISMNGLQEDEGYLESRRLDTPGNNIFTNGIFQTPPTSALADGKFPSSWLYPQSEQSLNPSSPSQRVITDKIFWDN